MCPICDKVVLSRRRLLGLATVAATSTTLLSGFPTASAVAQEFPNGVEEEGRRILIRGGYVMSMDNVVGNFVAGEVLIEGSRIVEISQSIHAPDAVVIDATGRVVMPGFVNTHHHHFETALRSYLPNGIMMADANRPDEPTYIDDIIGKLTPVYRPEDVYISELVGGLSQLEAGVTTALDVSQIHHSPEHSDAAVEAMQVVGRRGVFGYVEGSGKAVAYPQDARRIREQYFSSDDQLLTMAMGGEISIKGVETLDLWALGKDLDVPIALHAVGSLGMREKIDKLIPHFTKKHLFIHMTGMSDAAWERIREVGANVSLAVPIEMVMRHGLPPLQKALDLGIAPSLSTDVECTMTADFFTQIRSAITLQRAMANQAAIDGNRDAPALLTVKDVLTFATANGAEALGLGQRIGRLTVGRQADIILLNAEALNVVPLNNVPGAVVSLMDRSNVETVLVDGKVRKWKGKLVGHDVAALSTRLIASRDYLFERAGVASELFD